MLEPIAGEEEAGSANGPPSVAGLLLTGGRSSRMGGDKASLRVDGRPCAQRVADCLSAVAGPVIEVGPGYTTLPAVLEDPPGAGPLVAVCRGASALRDAGHHGHVLVIACDMPLVDVPTLRMLAEWPGSSSVVPTVDGHLQPLCARWSQADLFTASSLVDSGNRSMHALVAQSRVLLADESSWTSGVDASRFADIDTPEDLDRLGLRAMAP